jgi:hypothetical protein
MKSTKMPLDVRILLIICVIGTFIIVTFLVMPKRARGEYPGGSFTIVNRNDIKTIERLDKYKNNYAIKVQEGDKYFLELYPARYYGKYSIDKDKFDNLQEENYYWFYLKYSKPGDTSSGSIENVYDTNPLK